MDAHTRFFAMFGAAIATLNVTGCGSAEREQGIETASAQQASKFPAASCSSTVQGTKIVQVVTGTSSVGDSTRGSQDRSSGT